MIPAIIAGVIAAFVIAILLRSLWIRIGLNLRQTLLTVAAASAIIVIVGLTVTGRLNFMVAVLAAAIPLLRRSGALARWLPWLAALFSGLRPGSTPGPQPRSGADAGTTTTESTFFRMTLHHASGHIDGEIKLGTRKGRFLSELSLPELAGLLGEIQDYDSQRLLETYLDHHHPEWRRENRQNAAVGGQKMTRTEALSALGLADGATKDEVVAAHRRLIQRLHPDRGGTTYLAALLNHAKDTLTKDH